MPNKEFTLEQRDLPKLLKTHELAELVLNYDQKLDEYTIAIRLIPGGEVQYVYTQRGSVKAFKSIERAVSWGEEFNFHMVTAKKIYNKTKKRKNRKKQ